MLFEDSANNGAPSKVQKNNNSSSKFKEVEVGLGFSIFGSNISAATKIKPFEATNDSAGLKKDSDLIKPSAMAAPV